jgi:hypothetical protein
MTSLTIRLRLMSRVLHEALRTQTATGVTRSASFPCWSPPDGPANDTEADTVCATPEASPRRSA